MNIQIISVPYDSGLRHTRMGAGPQRLLNAGLAQRLQRQGHRVEVNTIEAAPAGIPAEIRTAFELQRAIAQQVRQSCLANSLPVVLAGNCNSAVGVLAGLHPADVGVVWFDCHGDYNTPETTMGGFLDGMALAMVTGKCWKQLTTTVPGFHPVEEHKILLIGARDLDPLEEELLRQSRICIFSTSAMRKDASKLTDFLPPSVQSVYVHLDFDVIDPAYASANAYATPGGLLVEELLAMLRLIKQTYRVAAVAFTAYDPALDPTGRFCLVAKQLMDTLVGE